MFMTRLCFLFVLATLAVVRSNSDGNQVPMYIAVFEAKFSMETEQEQHKDYNCTNYYTIHVRAAFQLLQGQLQQKCTEDAEVTLAQDVIPVITRTQVTYPVKIAIEAKAEQNLASAKPNLESCLTTLSNDFKDITANFRTYNYLEAISGDTICPRIVLDSPHLELIQKESYPNEALPTSPKYAATPPKVPVETAGLLPGPTVDPRPKHSSGCKAVSSASILLLTATVVLLQLDRILP